MVDADHHNNLNIKGSPAKRFFVNDYKSNIFWVEQTMECGIATLLSKLVGVTASRSRTESVKAPEQYPEQPVFLPYSVSYLPQNFRNDFFQIIADP